MLALCNPGTAPSENYPDARVQRERYEREFRPRLRVVAEDLGRRPNRNNAPEMESIRAVCIDAFRDAPEGSTLRMSIIGDMTQYSLLGNHHVDRNYDAYLSGRRLDAMQADCKGAQTDIYYVRRPTTASIPGPQGVAHLRFWELFLERIKARQRNVQDV